MNKRKKNKTQKALVLTELIIVIFIIAMIASIAMMNFPGMITRYQFERQANEFVDIVRKTITASAESGQRYAIMLNFDEQTYVLKEITKPYFVYIEDEFETPTMHAGQFTEQCWLDHVVFDDGYDTRDPGEGEQKFRANFFTSRSGLDFGGHIVLLDYDGNPYTIILNRLSRTVELLPGEYDIEKPIDKRDLPF